MSSKRIAQVQEALRAQDLAALVLVTHDTPRADGNNKNVDHLSGFTGSTGVVVVSQNDAVLVVDGRYTERAQTESNLRVVKADNTDRRVVDFSNYVVPGLDALSIPQGARVGIESLKLTHTLWNSWSALPRAMFVPTSYIVESLRQWKDAEEIAALRTACAKTCDVWNTCAPLIAAGKTEREVQLLFDMALREHGASANSFGTIVASGPNSASPHHETSDRVIQVGEPVTVDFGGVFEGGYCSDLTRTLFAPGREPDPKMLEIYRTVQEANTKAREALRIGMTWKEYDAVARRHIEEKGYGEYFGHGLGHSLGLEAHDPFNYAESTFQSGLVITDEPGIYVPGLGGVRIEDDLVLTENGVENLTAEAQYQSGVYALVTP
jgi:Xaa-Pro aminopeptidase